MGCAYCGSKHDRNESRLKCENCRVWTHKKCAAPSQLTLNGQWYCITHKYLLNINDSRLRNSNVNSNDLSSVNLTKNNNTIVNVNHKNNENPLSNNTKESNNSHASDDSQESIFIEESEKERLEQDEVNKSNKSAKQYDDGNYFNPFANFNCDTCNGKFTKDALGVLCKRCRTTFHIKCLNELEIEEVKKYQFICQHCILDEHRIEQLKERQRRDMKQKKQNNNTNNEPRIITSTPKTVINNNNTYKKNNKHVVIESEGEKEDSSDRSENFSRHKNSKHNRHEKKKVHKKKSSKTKNRQNYSSSSNSSDSSSEDSDDDITLNISKSEALTGLYLRSQHEKLPIVENINTKWAIFFSLFKKSRKLFSDAHNVVRIQESIKSKEILEMGGINLFDPATYYETLKLIDKHINRSNNLLENESNEIIKMKPFKGDNKKLLEFIHKIINYSNIVEKYGKKKDKLDDRVISHIANILPAFLRNSWHKVKAKREDQNKTIYIKTIAEFLSGNINTLSSQLQAENRDPWRETVVHNNIKKREEYSRKSYYINEKKEQDSSKQHCWLHNTDSHSCYGCKHLWSLSGKEVSDLARQNKVCTFCGQLREVSCQERCKNNEKLICKLPGCSYKHHILFCYKRKAKDDQNRISKNNMHETKKVEKLDKPRYRDHTDEKKKSSNKKKVNIHINNNLNNDEENESQSESESEEEIEHEINIPQNSFYINKPPKKIVVKQNSQTEKNTTSKKSRFGHIRQIVYSHNEVKRKTDDCLLSVVVIKINNSKENFAFLLDTGSTVSIIEQELADKLALHGLWDPLSLGWSGKVNRNDYGSRIIETEASSAHANAHSYRIHFRTMLDFGIEKQEFDAPEMYQLYSHLTKMNLFSYSNISGVIGIDNLWAFDQIKVFKPKKWRSNIPYGIRGPLGDYVLGSVTQLCDIYDQLKSNNKKNPKNASKQYIHTTKFDLEYYEIESRLLGDDYYRVYEKDNELVEDQQAIKLLEKYVKKAENNVNYEAPLLWKNENIILPTQKSFEVALHRYMIVEKTSIKNGKHEECNEQIKDLIRKNYAEEVPYEEIKSNNPKTFYIPTFFIHPKSKRSRFIWDAATKVNGFSLNDHLLSGPNLYNDFIKIIFQMREGKFMIKGDIREMFHQVWMRSEDRDALRFLFRENPNDKLKILRMRVMIFGSKSSPITSQFVKNKIARDFVHSHPDATDIIINNTYVDDVITSTNDEHYGSKLFDDIRTILKSGGFNLVKLNSNNNDILNLIKESLSENELANDKIFSSEREEKLLGYLINFEKDTIAIALTLEKIPTEILTCEKRPTKKQVLQLCMSIFDPLGFVEFLLSKFKLLYHWIVKENYEWNQIIDEKYFKIWKSLIISLTKINEIKIPRLYSFEIETANIIQLVGFGDAGTEILCNTVYLRFLNEKREQIDFHFVCAKSYIVPLKQNRTIPELELDAATKLVNLCSKIISNHRIKIDEKIYFTDNSAVYEWITNGIRNPKVYVKNRLTKIQKMSKSSEWKWIPTHFQTADFGTKITSMPEMKNENAWFCPKIFSLGEDNWPKLVTNKIEIERVNMIHCIAEQKDSHPIKIENFSSLNKLITYAQSLLKWKWVIERNNLRYELKKSYIELKKHKYKSVIRQKIAEVKSKIACHYSKLNNSDYKYKQIESALIRQAQNEAYGKDYFMIKNKKAIAGQNPLKKLIPFIDEHGVMRANSRISTNENNLKIFGYDRINPIILPRKHHLTKLIILKAHNALAHININTVIINLLQRFHINKIKRTVSETIKSDCWKCNIANAKPEIPLMGDLPSYRLAVHMPAFTYAICDLLGPVVVKLSRNKTAKRWILVYSCLTTRAIHLELIESLDSHSTLRALQTTFNLRGAPRKILSDNGTNFTGSYNIIKECHSHWNKELLEKGKIIETIEWEFSPPRSPHTNGSVERMVGLTKRALKKIKSFMVERHSHYDDFTLRAILSEIINMLNSRPIGLNYYDDDKHEFLTPNHFIMGRQNAQSVPPSLVKPKLLREQWQDIKIMTNILWENWLKAFVPNILMREKWIDRSKPLERGDIVITQDPSIANSWRLGVIEKTILGSKNQVRQVVIRLGKNEPLNWNSNKNRNKLLNDYRKEKISTITRSALAVAKIKLRIDEIEESSL